MSDDCTGCEVLHNENMRLSNQNHDLYAKLHYNITERLRLIKYLRRKLQVTRELDEEGFDGNDCRIPTTEVAKIIKVME